MYRVYSHIYICLKNEMITTWYLEELKEVEWVYGRVNAHVLGSDGLGSYPSSGNSLYRSFLACHSGIIKRVLPGIVLKMP